MVSFIVLSAASTSDAWVTSHWIAGPPVIAATVSAASPFISIMATLAPFSANISALALPKPDPPPVTTTDFPSIFIRLSLLAPSGFTIHYL